MNVPSIRRVAFPLAGDSLGGAQRATLELAVEMSRRAGFEVTLVWHGAGREYESWVRASRVEVARLSTDNLAGPPAFDFRSRRRLVLDVLRFSMWARRCRIDLIHTNDLRMHRMWGRAAVLVGIPWIAHRRKAGPLPLSPRLTSKSSAILAISAFVAGTMPGEGNSGAATCLVHDAVADPALDRDTLDRKWKDAGACLKVVFLGNVTPQKRFDFFLEIARELERRGVSGDFDFKGAGRDPSGVATKNSGCLPGVGFRWLGEIASPYELLVDAHVLVAPATREGFGRTLVEAQFARAVVLAADDAGHREIIEDGRTGYLLPAEDVAAFADRLQEVARRRNEGSLGELLDRAAERSREQFSMARLGDEMEAVYRGI